MLYLFSIKKIPFWLYAILNMDFKNVFLVHNLEYLEQISSISIDLYGNNCLGFR